jgi:hypothetical protein
MAAGKSSLQGHFTPGMIGFLIQNDPPSGRK